MKPTASELEFQKRLTLYTVTVPTPLSDSTACELEALLPKVSDPDIVPVLCGVKATFNDRLWPAATVKGKEAPCRTYCELLLLAEDTVTLAPEALTVMGRVWVVFSGTLPKLSGAGAMVNWPDAVPVPFSGMESVGPVANRLPPSSPADCGAKVTFTVTL